MKITKNIINDLLPLYAEKECSADTRALVEEYLKSNPQEAEELRRAMSIPLPGPVPSPKDLGEVQSLQKARRLVRLRSWLLGLAIFFSLAPFSVLHTDKTYWLFREAPLMALGYGFLGAVCWIGYAVTRCRAQSL